MSAAGQAIAVEATDVERAAEGDDVAFGRLVARYDGDLRRVAYVITGDLALAQDAAQSAWVAAWRRMRSVRDPSRVRAWLLQIAVNEARQILRRRRRGQVVPIEMDSVQDDLAAGAIGRVDLSRALAGLTPDDRALLALRYVAGLEAAELGAATGRSASGTRARLSRLTARLRTELER